MQQPQPLVLLATVASSAICNPDTMLHPQPTPLRNADTLLKVLPDLLDDSLEHSLG
ncbi:MAG: hypothetical protein WBD25_18570 [Terriglobales bacterium]